MSYNETINPREFGIEIKNNENLTWQGFCNIAPEQQDALHRLFSLDSFFFGNCEHESTFCIKQ